MVHIVECMSCVETIDRRNTLDQTAGRRASGQLVVSHSLVRPCSQRPSALTVVYNKIAELIPRLSTHLDSLTIFFRVKLQNLTTQLGVIA